MDYQSTMPTAFEKQVRKLGLVLWTCVASKELRQWCELNKDRCYIPEWLLERWEKAPLAFASNRALLLCSGGSGSGNCCEELLGCRVAASPGKALSVNCPPGLIWGSKLRTLEDCTACSVFL